MDRFNETVEAIGKHRIGAILRTHDTGIARRAMRAAVVGGFRVIEFTMSIPGALDLVEEFQAERGLVVGAGTVLTAAQAKDAVAAGARFVVSPVVDPEVIRAALDLGIPAIPGSATPTEMAAARRAGAPIVKVFPAPADLPAFISQVLGPLPDLKLFPTSGVTLENFASVLAAGAFGVGFVGSLFPAAELAAGDYGAVEARARAIHERLRSI